MDNRRAISFTDLKAWQECHKLCLQIYKLARSFPSDEQFGLASQIKRASVSVTSNIAEGSGRSAQKDKEHFYVMASGSLYEVKSQLLLARDLNFISASQFSGVADQANSAHRLLNGLIKSHKASEKS